MTSRPYPATRVLFAAALIIGLLGGGGGAGATVVTTCRAAASSDAGVDYRFCVLELGKHRDSPDADVWGLAKVAALTGVNNADDAVYGIKAELGGSGSSNNKKKPATGAAAALARCQKLYDAVGFAFAEATDAINSRDYAAGKAKVAQAVSLTRQCDDAVAKAGAVPSPVARYSSYSVKIAVVCTAITNLIK